MTLRRGGVRDVAGGQKGPGMGAAGGDSVAHGRLLERCQVRPGQWIGGRARQVRGSGVLDPGSTSFTQDDSNMIEDLGSRVLIMAIGS